MKILILSSSAGNGHNSTAKKIKNKILENHSDYEIEIIDVYKSFTSKFKSWTMSDGYIFACNHFVNLYNHFFKKSEKNDISTKDTNSANKDTYCFLTGLLNKIYTFKPDLIISTYIFCTVGLTNLKRYYDIPAKIFCMTLDYGISPYWESASCVDKMFITGDYMLKPFLDKGYSKDQLVVSGIPVGEQFSEKITEAEARKELNLDPDKFTVLVTKSGFFSISDKNIIKQFETIKTPMQIIFLSGKNEKQITRINKIVKSYKNSIHSYYNYGFVDKIETYFSASDIILTKGGGLTTTECLNKHIPMLIIDKLPQQEIYNKQYLVENNCAIDINKTYKIADALNDIIDKKIDIKTYKKNMEKIAKQNSLKMIIDEVDKIESAIYPDELVANHTKREVIKNVDRARRETIKKQREENGK